MSYLKSLQSLTPSITAAGGTPLTITAEPAANVEKSRAASGYTGAAISDPDNFIAAKMRERGSVDVAVTAKNGYPHGLAQPAILIIRKDGEVLYSWAIEPKTVCMVASPVFAWFFFWSEWVSGLADSMVMADESGWCYWSSGVE